MLHHPNTKEHCAKAYLDHVRDQAIRMQALQEQIERKRSMMEPSAVSYQEGSAPAARGDAVEAAVIELHGLISEYCTELVGYVADQREAHAAIMSLPDPLQVRALSLRYLDALPWAEVCARMGYSRDGMMKLHRRALPEVYDRMPEPWRRDPIPNAMPR